MYANKSSKLRIVKLLNFLANKKNCYYFQHLEFFGKKKELVSFPDKTWMFNFWRGKFFIFELKFEPYFKSYMDLKSLRTLYDCLLFTSFMNNSPSSTISNLQAERKRLIIFY